MAQYKRQISKAKFIAITGSVGKTSTKEAMKTILKPFGKIFATRSNFNNYLGLSINLASMPVDTEFAVFEMGISLAGEMRSLAQLVKPDVVVITSISEAHLEFFDSVLDIVDAKCEIFEDLKSDAIAVINLDNKYYGRILFNIEQLHIKHFAGIDIDKKPIKKIYNFGKARSADVRLVSYKNCNDKVNIIYSCPTIPKELNLTLPIIPEHHAKNLSACLTVILALNLDLDVAASELSKIELIIGRGKIINVSKNKQEYQLICDHYNANPESLKASLEHLATINHKKKIAIIGDMLNLGVDSIKLHRDLAEPIINSGIMAIYLVGTYVAHIIELLPKNIHVIHFHNVDLLLEVIDDLIENDALILIKGSKSVGLVKIYDKLI
jgi:UDP-N-acetylmuramoyl-tripeptide--D-alanyl-D-alanine ligase